MKEEEDSWERVKALDPGKLTAEDMADTSAEDARREANFQDGGGATS